MTPDLLAAWMNGHAPQRNKEPVSYEARGVTAAMGDPGSEAQSSLMLLARSTSPVDA